MIFIRGRCYELHNKKCILLSCKIISKLILRIIYILQFNHRHFYKQSNSPGNFLLKYSSQDYSELFTKTYFDKPSKPINFENFPSWRQNADCFLVSFLRCRFRRSSTLLPDIFQLIRVIEFLPLHFHAALHYARLNASQKSHSGVRKTQDWMECGLAGWTRKLPCKVQNMAHRKGYWHGAKIALSWEINVSGYAGANFLRIEWTTTHLSNWILTN